MIKIQDINFPEDCQIVNHDFYDYNPVDAYNKPNSLKYLNEDLLQCSFPEDEVIIDLGWYGDVITNKGEFRIYIIQNENWEIPFNIIHSKSADETKGLLIKILDYYTRKIPEQIIENN